MEFEEGTPVYPFKDDDKYGLGYDVVCDHCPECEEFIVVYRLGRYSEKAFGQLAEVQKEDLLYPKRITRTLAPEVPDRYRNDFIEACATLPVSPKASAALSRRLLQDIFHNQYGIQERSLQQEISKFIDLKDVPSYLATAVDAVRNVGNFAAHPSKDSNTGEVVDVEPGEAEWLLEVLEALFDFTFIQPKRLEERKQALNNKLDALGKPPMK